MLENKFISEDAEFFGTDGANFSSNGDGVFIVKGDLYPITKSQFNPSNGDITRDEALRILNIKVEQNG